MMFKILILHRGNSTGEQGVHTVVLPGRYSEEQADIAFKKFKEQQKSLTYCYTDMLIIPSAVSGDC